MAQVSAPYNFVPLNKKVFFPPWADLVTHDVPFKDGLSGQIELEITAESPIFIRGEGESKTENNNSYTLYKFPKHNNKFYIPGSSIKGEIANVLEIMSFSKLRFFNDVKYSQREWDTIIYRLRDFANVKGGWLSINENGDFLIEYSSENPGRITHTNLNQIFNEFSNEYNNIDNIAKKLAKNKYIFTKMLNNDSIVFNTSKYILNPIRNQNNYDNRKFYKKTTNENNNAKEGTLVFTGQSSSNANGKKAEFIFWKPNNPNPAILTKDDIRIRSFKAAYFDGAKNESEDWKMWKKHLNKGGKVPIFITIENGKVAHFGLSMLYKLPYKKSIQDIIDNYSNSKLISNEYDFVDTLFGSIDDNKLKGRVHFGHAFSTNTVNEFDKPITTVLGSPKPTFYPFYIEQNFKEKNGISDDFEIKGNYLTFNDGVISGRKRYPIRVTDNKFFDNPIFDLPKTKSTTTFLPLKKGAKFTCNINFYNLCPEELGGLLSALTFHGDNEKRHSIGMAKPMGLGNVKLEVSNLFIDKEDKKSEIDNYLCVFEKRLNQELDIEWHKTEQIKELFAIATPIDRNLEKLKYLILEIPAQQIGDQFSQIKQDKNALPKYSKFMGINISISSKINSACSLQNYVKIKEKFYSIKKKYQVNIVKKISYIEQKINEIQSVEKQKQGIDLSNISNYTDLIRKIDIFKTDLNMDKETPFKEPNIINSICEALDTVYSSLKGKKKKLFIKQSKINTVSNWIGKEKAEEWFKSKNNKQ